MKTGRSLLIDHMVLYGILHDDQLYTIPGLAPLREQGKAAYRALVERALSPGRCGSCVGAARIMQPIQDAFGQALADCDSASQDAFIAYVTRKRGYRPDPIFMYYVGRDGQAYKLVI